MRCVSYDTRVQLLKGSFSENEMPKVIPLFTSGVARGVKGFVDSGKKSCTPSSCQPQFQIPSVFARTSAAGSLATRDCGRTSEAEWLLLRRGSPPSVKRREYGSICTLFRFRRTLFIVRGVRFASVVRINTCRNPESWR